MSSLTGHGYDNQEILEELAPPLNDLRPNCGEPRLKAARAVKVAEHAIQSAEKRIRVKIGKIQSTQGAEAATTAQKIRRSNGQAARC
jgi:hypothetical protein